MLRIDLKDARACLAAGLVALGGLASQGALAAGGEVHVRDHDWSFEGPFGTFDRMQLQRGWQVFMEVCRTCHGLELLAFRNLGEPGGPEFPPEQVRAFAQNWEVPFVNSLSGEIERRQAEVTDAIVGPYFDDVEAADLNGGTVPPDLSVIVKARTGYHGIITQILEGGGGPEYVYSVLTGYAEEDPENFDAGDGYFNYYFPGHVIAMGPPMQDGQVEYAQEDVEPTVAQMSQDVVAFLTWAAEPHMEARKEAGVRNLAVLAIFAVLLWYSNRRLWKPVKEGHIP